MHQLAGYEAESSLCGLHSRLDLELLPGVARTESMDAGSKNVTQMRRAADRDTDFSGFR
jgi:hypothetical protein